MVAAQCLCGFTELEDEQMSDHLQRIFAPDHTIGNDGRAHEEGGRLLCFCGFTARATEELDEHFLKVFTPDDGIGHDGRGHARVDNAVAESTGKSALRVLAGIGDPSVPVRVRS